MQERIILGMLLLHVVACGKKKEENVSPTIDSSVIALQLPPQSSLDFSTGEAFDDASTESLALTNKINYGFARAAVGLTSLSLGLRLAIPLAVIEKAVEQTPSYEGNGKWLWAFETAISGVAYGVQLLGEHDMSENSFSVSISRSPKDSYGCCEDFIWFEGTANEENTAGIWTFYDPQTPEERAETATLSWDGAEDDHRSLIFTVKKIEDFSSGWKVDGYVAFEIDGDGARMEVEKDIDTPEKTVVAWSTSALSGSFQSENGQQYCWDENLENAVCPE